jgi:hypothetical protein
MSDDSFFDRLKPLSSFEALTDPANHHPVPDDWSLAVADVVNSSAAIDRGEYKSVNTVGVSVIAATLNALRPLELPYVFGGDGAVVAYPSSRDQDVRAALAASAAMSRDRFGLDLRAAVVPVSFLRSLGHTVLVGRYRVSPHVSQAAFSGDGIAAAERLLKEGRLVPAMLIEPDRAASADYSGLECRWSEVPSPSEETVALIVQGSGGVEAMLSEYRRVMERINEIYGNEQESHPVREKNLRVSFSSFILRNEERVRTWGRTRWQRLKYALWQRIAVAIGWWFFRTGRRTSETDWSQYKPDLVAHTDHRKMDGQLRIVLSGRRVQRERLESFLRERVEAGALRFGLHAAPSAILTCLVFRRQHEHVHFVDASGGGYAAAAKGMKS